MTQTTEPVLLIEKKDGIAVLTLNRPGAMNALNAPLREALAAAFEALKGDAETDVVILTGAGRAFCAGLDLKELADPGSPRTDRFDPPAQIRALPQPVIGAVNGVAITGGFEIATSCDFLIASPTPMRGWAFCRGGDCHSVCRGSLASTAPRSCR